MIHKDNTKLCIFIVLAIMIIKFSALVLVYATHDHAAETEHNTHHEIHEKKYYKTNRKSV